MKTLGHIQMTKIETHTMYIRALIVHKIVLPFPAYKKLSKYSLNPLQPQENMHPSRHVETYMSVEEMVYLG
jgi:hypothetical protein